MVIEEKIKEICARKNFTSFWECLDYMILANYEELEAIMMSLEIFEGDVWGNVINAAKAVKSNRFGGNQFGDEVTMCFSGSSITTGYNASGYTVLGHDPYTAEPDDLLVDIYVMTNEGTEVYKPLYKSYIETRNVKSIPDLEKHIKMVRINLTSEIGIKLFEQGYKNF